VRAFEVPLKSRLPLLAGSWAAQPISFWCRATAWHSQNSAATAIFTQADANNFFTQGILYTRIFIYVHGAALVCVCSASK